MKVGAGNVPKLVASIALTVLAVFLTGRWMLGSTPVPPPSITEAGTTACTGEGAGTGRSRPVSSAPLDPTLQVARLETSEGKEYEGTGRNIFSLLTERSRSRTPLRPQGPSPIPVTRSSRPGIRLRFFGFVTGTNSPKKIFFSQDGDVFVGKEGDVIDRRYRIVRIHPESVEVEDLLENTVEILALREG